MKTKPIEVNVTFSKPNFPFEIYTIATLSDQVLTILFRDVLDLIVIILAHEIS